MNTYKLHGQLVSWSSEIFSRLGWKNIERIHPSKNHFLIEMKDGSKYQFEFKRVD